MRTAMATLVAAIVMVAVGCGGQSSGGSSPGDAGTTPPDGSVTTTSTDEPAPEPTDAESSQPEQRKPGFELATAPAGGNADDAGVEQCASVSLTGVDLAEGTTITLGGVTLEPDGIFQLDQGICEGRACPDVQWTKDSRDSCYVGARQVAAGSDPVKVVVAAVVTCASEEDCQTLKGAAEKVGSSVAFVPGELTSTSETPTGG